MSPITRRLTVPAALLVALLAGPVLAGCSAVNVNEMVKDATGGTVDVGGSTIPEDFPAEVPLPEGEILNANAVGTGTGKVWNVTVAVTGAATPDGIAESFGAAGFRATSDIPGLGSLGGNAGFTNDVYGVAVVVTDDAADSYTANFSVIAVPQ